MIYRLIEYLASMGHSSIWKLICAICVCNILTVGVHLSSTPSISGSGSATGDLGKIYFKYTLVYGGLKSSCIVRTGADRECLLRSAMAGRLYKLQSKHTLNSGFDQTFMLCSCYILFAAEQRVGYQISWVDLQRKVNSQ